MGEKGESGSDPVGKDAIFYNINHIACNKLVVRGWVAKRQKRLMALLHLSQHEVATSARKRETEREWNREREGLLSTQRATSCDLRRITAASIRPRRVSVPSLYILYISLPDLNSMDIREDTLINESKRDRVNNVQYNRQRYSYIDRRVTV